MSADPQDPYQRILELETELAKAGKEMAAFSKRLEAADEKINDLEAKLKAEKELRLSTQTAYATNQGEKFQEQRNLIEGLLKDPELQDTDALTLLIGVLDKLGYEI